MSLLARHLITHEAKNEIIDAVYSQLEAAGRTDFRNEIFFEQDHLSPKSLEIIAAWFSETKNLKASSVYRKIEQWGDSAIPLLGVLSSTYDFTTPTGDAERVEAVAALATHIDLSSYIKQKTIDKTREKQIDSLLSCLGRAKVFSNKSALELLSWVPEKKEDDKLELAKHKLVTSGWMSYYLQHFRDLSPELHLQLKNRMKFLFDLPSDKTTDEILKAVDEIFVGCER